MLPGRLDVEHLATQAFPEGEAEGPLRPGWKPFFYRGRPSIEVAITERVMGVQYDQDDIADICEVYGTVDCLADVEGVRICCPVCVCVCVCVCRLCL